MAGVIIPNDPFYGSHGPGQTTAASMGPEGVQNIPAAHDPGQRGATPQDFGSDIGQALEQAGHVINGIGATIGGLQKERQGATDSIAAQTFNIKYNQRLNDNLDASQKAALPGAPDFAQTFMKDLPGEREKYLADFAKQYGVSPKGLQHLQLIALENEANVGHRATAWGNNQAVDHLKLSTAQNIDDLSASAAAHGDFASVVKSQNSILETAQKSRIMDPNEFEVLKKNATSAVKSSFETYAKNVSNTPFSDKQALLSKWDNFESEIKSLPISDGEKDLLRQQYGGDFAANYAKQHPDEIRPPATAQTQVGGNYETRLMQIESRGGQNIRNPHSSAFGPYQFTTATARQYGITPDSPVADQRAAFLRLTEDNRAALRNALGRDPTDGELYLAHQQGSGGAIALLSHPNELATDVVGQQAVMLNGGAPGMTAQQFADKWTSRFRGTSGSAQAGLSAPSGPPANAPDLGPLNKYITGDTWVAMQREAETAQNQAIALGRLHATEEKDRLDLGITTGQVTNEADILSNTIINDGDKATLIRALQSKNAQAIDQGAAVKDYVTGTGAWNPFDSDTKKKADLVDDAAVKASPNITDQQLTSLWRDMAENKGVTSTHAVNWLRQQIASGDPSKAAAAYSLADYIGMKAPQALTARDGGKAIADDAVAYRHLVTDLGYDPAKAVQLIQAQQEEAQKRDVKTLQSQAEAKSKTFTTADVANVFTGTGILHWFDASPQVGFDGKQAEQIVNDYRELYNNRYIESGDENITRAKANADMKVIYGMSNVSGTSTLMRYPPENFAPPVAGSTDYLQQLVLDDARQASGNPNLQHGDAYLWYNENTATQARLAKDGKGPPPSYALYYKAIENGQPIWHRASQDFRLGVSDLKKAQDAVGVSDQQARTQHHEFKTMMDGSGLIGGGPSLGVAPDQAQPGLSGLPQSPTEKQSAPSGGSAPGVALQGNYPPLGGPPSRPRIP